MKVCPFCGAAMQPGFDQAQENIIYWSHPKPSNPNRPGPITCPGDGSAMGVSSGVVELWNERAYFMELVDDHPVFNEQGIGKKVDMKMVNDVIKYYRDLATYLQEQHHEAGN